MTFREEMTGGREGVALIRFHVAVWRVWSFSQSASFLPDYFGEVEAPSAFLAIAGLMRLHQLNAAPHAAAIAHDGSIAYRAYRIRLAPPVQEQEERHEAGQQQRGVRQASLWK